MEYYLAIKRNAFESILVRWTNLEFRSKSERERPIPYISISRKMVLMKLFAGQE